MKSILLLAYLITNVCGLSQMPKPPIEAQGKMAKAMAREAANVALAVSVLVVPGGALAARSGGRAGGSSFLRSAPRAAAPALTTRYSAPVAMPVPVSPYGYGYGGYGYGGYGYGGYGYGYGYGGDISPEAVFYGFSLFVFSEVLTVLFYKFLTTEDDATLD
uniref:Uncharacterized protein n=1 Tax=Aureoumbra lagunensis TaxID=44058 RepID=A0A7S3K2U4_9STRA